MKKRKKRKKIKKPSELGISIGISRILMIIGVLGILYGGGYAYHTYYSGKDMEIVEFYLYHLYVGIIVFVIGKILNKGYDKIN